MNKLFIAAAFMLLSSFALAEPIEVNGPFYRQLVAMGYSLEESDSFTLARRSGVTILVTKDENYTWIGRMFFAKKRKDIDAQLYGEALDAVNKANIDFVFRTTLNEESIICGIHLFGEYSPSTYGTALSEIEKCNFIFDRYPVLMKLNP